MTDFEIEKIKEHIQIHSSKEPQAKLITEILNKAIKELEQNKWFYSSKGEIPEDGTTYFCFVKNSFGEMVNDYGFFSKGNWFNNYDKEPVCWMNAFPPKED
jgi:hypothetical protein